jgi:acyl dehydratase
VSLRAGPFAGGQVLPERSYTVTRDDVRRYAEASGDHNPVHLCDQAAREAGFEGVVAHGMLTLALVGRALEEWAGGAGTVRELRATFTRPVVVPDDEDGTVLTVGGVVRSVEEQDDGAVVTVALAVTCGIDTVLGGPRATLEVPGDER